MQRIAIAGFTGLIATVGGYAACPTDTECTLEARPSVVVQTVERASDGSFVPVKADGVSYVINPHPSVEAPRSALPESADPSEPAECANAECTEWIAGREEPGEFTVTADVCGKKFTDVALVELTDDECHVDTQTLVMEVDRSMCVEKRGDDVLAAGPMCTREARPSVIVQTVRRVDDMVIPTTPESIRWSYSKGPRKSMEATCADAECTVFYGPWEQAGSFVFEATYCGKTIEKAITVGANACHVETGSIWIEFDEFHDSCLADQPDLPPVPPQRPGGPTDITAPPPTPDAPKDAPPPPTRPEGPQDLTQPPPPPTMPTQSPEPNRPGTPGSLTQPPPLPGPASMDIDGSCLESGIRVPAFVLHTFKQVGDMLVPVRAEKVEFTTENAGGDMWKAECLDDSCSMWKGAHRGATQYIATATVCGVETEARFDVAARADGCGVITEFPYLAVDTTGCVTAQPEEVGTPWTPPTITTPPQPPGAPPI